MDQRLTDILRYALLIIVLLVGFLFLRGHYNRYSEKKDIVAEVQSITSDSSFYRQFKVEDAHATLLRSIALLHRADELGLPPADLLDRVFKTRKDDGMGRRRNPPAKEKLARDTLTSAYEAAKRLEILDADSIETLGEGTMPLSPNGFPVILPLIDPELSPGLEKILPNLEILPPDRNERKRVLTTIETAAARRLARDLGSGGLIDRTIADQIIEHYTAPEEEQPEDG